MKAADRERAAVIKFLESMAQKEFIGYASLYRAIRAISNGEHRK